MNNLLEELSSVNPENLSDEAKELHKSIMFLINERDLYKSVIDEAIKHIKSLSSKGRGCEIYADVKKDILAILYKAKEGDKNE